MINNQPTMDILFIRRYQNLKEYLELCKLYKLNRAIIYKPHSTNNSFLLITCEEGEKTETAYTLYPHNNKKEDLNPNFLSKIANKLEEKIKNSDLFKKLQNSTEDQLEKFYLIYMISCAIIGLPIAMLIYYSKQ